MTQNCLHFAPTDHRVVSRTSIGDFALVKVELTPLSPVRPPPPPDREENLRLNLKSGPQSVDATRQGSSPVAAPGKVECESVKKRTDGPPVGQFP